MDFIIDGIRTVTVGLKGTRMLENSKYGRIDWRRYLIAEYHPRVKKFLEYRGDEVFAQISQMIGGAIESNKKEIALLVHPNVNNVVVIKKHEYQEVLDLALTWFEKKEDYMVCHQIREVKNLLRKRKRQNVKQTLKK